MTARLARSRGRETWRQTRALLAAWLAICTATVAPAQEPLRPVLVDAAAPEPPGDWKTVDRRLYESYAESLANGPIGQTAGGIHHSEYRLELQDDGSLTGVVSGTFHLVSAPAILPVGRPSFAVSEFTIDAAPAVWGTDARGVSCVACPRDTAEFRLRCSQQGVRRGESLEFVFDWLTSVTTQVALTVPEDMQVEGSGFLLTAQQTASDKRTIVTLEAGARSNSTLRIVPRRASPTTQPGFELKQTVSASSTKLLIQSNIGVLSPTAGPVVAEIEIPAGFTLLRATLPGNERLPVERPTPDGRLLRIGLGELAVGQRAEFRLTMERAADWAQPQEIPRVAPRNGLLLREEWSLQVEKPLELFAVDAPRFLQTALTVESDREVWTWQGTSRDARMVVTARFPMPALAAECLTRKRLLGQRIEIQTLVDLRSAKSPLFEFDVDILKPWKIVSVSSADSAGQASPLSFEHLSNAESASRYRVFLRSPAAPQKAALVSILVAAQSAAVADSELRPVVIPIAETIEQFVALGIGPAGENPSDELGPPVPLSELRPNLRSTFLTEPEEQGTLTIRRVIRTPAPARRSLPVNSASLGPRDLPRPAGSQTPLTPLSEAVSVVELETALGAATTDSSSHRALFVFDQAVDVSGAVVTFDGNWTLLEVRCDGLPLDLAAVSGEIRFPELPHGVREISIRYGTPGIAEGLPRIDRIAWPQLPSRVERWVWRIQTPPDRRVTAIHAPIEFEGGISRLPLRARLLAPLGREFGEPVFNPFRVASWGQILSSSGTVAAASSPEPAAVLATGYEYPTTTEIVSWSSQRLDWLAWVIFFGSMLTIAIIRTVLRRTFRIGGIILAMAATGAWLLPSPFGSMAGAVLCGSGLAFFLPRRLIVPESRRARVSGASTIRFAGVSTVVIAWLSSSAAFGLLQPPPMEPNVLFVKQAGQPEAVVRVSSRVAADISAWERDRLGPIFLLRGARYDIRIDETEVASINMEFDVVVPRPDVTRTIQLPFEGLTFRGPDAAVVNGNPSRLIPTVDGGAIVISLPLPEATEESSKPAGPATYRIELQAAMRVPLGPQRREFAITVPRCAAALGVVHSTRDILAGLRTNARGRLQRTPDSLTCALGGASNWRVRWNNGAATDRSIADSSVNGRAESVVFAEPESLRFQTRVIVELPELADPFASNRLELRLPPGCIVSAVTGETVALWRTVIDADATRVLVDLSTPAIVNQFVDLQYELPVDATKELQIPPVPLLPARLSGHQIAVATSPAFRAAFLSGPDPDAGRWELEPSEAAFSIRKDLGLAIPSAAMELESPAALALELVERKTSRTAELEQSLAADPQSILWTGTARIETAVRPAFLYEFRVDPAIQITSASVTERDVERLSRFIREGDRLLLIVGDDRLGTKNVRLAGRFTMEAGKSRDIPVFTMQDAVITRNEVVVTSSNDQLLQVRRREGASVLAVPQESEWEPLAPSSRRIALPTTNAPYEMRWINPANPLQVSEFLRLPDTPATAAEIEWRLESSQQLPSILAIEAPHGTVVAPASDYLEANRRPLSGDRERIELQPRIKAAVDAVIRMSVPVLAAANGIDELPRLSDLAVRPVTWLAVPSELLTTLEIPGDFLDQLPRGAPAAWEPLFNARKLLVFAIAGTTWRMAPNATSQTLGTATAEVVVSESAHSIRGQTRWIVVPSRVGLMRLAPPRDGAINAVRASSGTAATSTESAEWELLLRPSQPVSVLAEWTTAKTALSTADLLALGPTAVGLEVQTTFAAFAPALEPSTWSPDFLSTAPASDRLAAVRLENLLDATRLLPIGVSPPAWLRDELLDLSRQYRDSPRAGKVALQVTGLLDSWASKTDTTTSPHSVAPDGLKLKRDPQRLLAEGLLIAAADPDLTVVGPSEANAWTLPRRVFNALFASAWAIVWAFVITKGAQWAVQRQLADRLARRPAVALAALGVGWWLFLSPSALGAVIALGAAIWELARRRWQKLAPPHPDAASI